MQISSPQLPERPNVQPVIEPGGFWIKTYGCQMNVYDSQRISELLQQHGYHELSSPHTAEILILNTCHIREKATEKVYSELGRLRARAKGADNRIYIVAGCVAQAEGEMMLAQARIIDGLVGPQELHLFPEVIKQCRLARTDKSDPAALATDAHKRGEIKFSSGKTKKLLALELTSQLKFDTLPEERKVNGVSAFLTIQEGCDKYCSFCVVPYTRGAEYSRPQQQIITEAINLAERGARDITLLGQNVNGWSGQDPRGNKLNFAKLIKSLQRRVPQVLRWRFVTSHPNDMDDELIELFGASSRLMPYLHLPIQSGSDRILRAMNRRYSADEYLRLAERLYHQCSDLALSSDFIVGFPGETEDDFAATCRIAAAVNIVRGFSFLYSARPGTPAADKLATPLSERSRQILQERLLRLQRQLTVQTIAYNERQLGRELAVLFEAPGRSPGQWRGKTAWQQSVHVKSSQQLRGQVLPVAITAATENSMTGVLATTSANHLAPSVNYATNHLR